MSVSIGKAYLFHTHLGIWLGRVVEVHADEVVLDTCSWIAEQGRMGACVRDGTWDRNEYVGDGVHVPRVSIKVPWRHPLPKTDK